MTDFNPKDTEYLSRLQDYYADWKSIPSYARLCEVFGIASKSWVKAILTRLGEAGFIERTPDGAWIPTRQFFARPLAEFHTFRQNITENYWRCLEMAPSLAEYARQGRQEGRLIGTADLPNVYRKPYGLGWALAGDAGHHEDPLMGHGIMNAFHDAELLSNAVDAGLSGRLDMQTALSAYEEQRNSWSLPAYQRNVAGARLEGWDSPQELKLRAALRHNPLEASRYFGVRVYAVPYEEFFAPYNTARIIEGVLQK